MTVTLQEFANFLRQEQGEPNTLATVASIMRDFLQVGATDSIVACRVSDQHSFYADPGPALSKSYTASVSCFTEVTGYRYLDFFLFRNKVKNINL